MHSVIRPRQIYILSIGPRSVLLAYVAKPREGKSPERVRVRRGIAPLQLQVAIERNHKRLCDRPRAANHKAVPPNASSAHADGSGTIGRRLKDSRPIKRPGGSGKMTTGFPP